MAMPATRIPPPTSAPPPEEHMKVTPVRPTTHGAASRFTGAVHTTMISVPEAPSYLSAGIVRFSPGARTNWHVHRNGQKLHVLDGIALVATRDGSVVGALPGETVDCPPGVDHWHGATADATMSHVAMVVGGSGHDGT
jgi:quercetin dioxygenase-like cupin family protein